jgi:hypothetical protein
LGVIEANFQMKRSLAILLLLFIVSINLSGQKTVESYTKVKDSLRIGSGKTDFLPYQNKGFTLVLPDTTRNVCGVIISLEEDKFDLNGDAKQQIYQQAAARGFAVLYLSTGIPADFYFSPASLSFVDTTLLAVFNKFNLPNQNIFFLGVSLAGHRASMLNI